VSVTLLLSGNGAKQVVGQLIPVGLLVTVPAPLPLIVTVRLLFPTIFSPNTANPDAKPVGETNVLNCVPLAMSNL